MAELERLLELLRSPHLEPELELLLDIGVAILLALLAGAAAVRAGLPAVVGYVLAGVLIGPFTPGFVGDQGRIGAIGELGIVFLLFALGVQMSVAELVRLGRFVAVGAVGMTLGATAVTALAAGALGVPLGAAIVMGAALSISSTLVLVKLLSGRGDDESLHGRLAVGISVAQDLITVILVVAIGAVAGGGDATAPLLIAVAKAAVFLGLSYVVGMRVLPRVFQAVARLDSPELFLLAVFGTAVLAALVSSAVFGLSLALGAFVAGLLISESDIAHQSAAEIIPFRDLFAVLFFVSVGMLVEPAALVQAAPLVLLLVALSMAAKLLITAGASVALGLPARSALLAGAALASSGEFTFVLGGAALSGGIVTAGQYSVLLGAAVATIVLASPLFSLAHRLAPALDERLNRATPHAAPKPDGDDPLDRRRHVVVLGAGEVGRLVSRALSGRGFTPVVVDRDRGRLAGLGREFGAVTIFGDPANPAILGRAIHPTTRLVVLALPDALTIRLAAQRIRALWPGVEVVARANRASEVAALRALGIERIVESRAEAGVELARQSLQRLGVSGPELLFIVRGLRGVAYGRAGGDHS